MRSLITTLAATLFSLSAMAQSPQRHNIYMDSIGVVHTDINLLPQVAMTGNYTDLLNKPSSTTSITAGNGILITGSGTVGSPYVIAVVQPTITQPTRALNTNFTPSTTKAAILYYSLSTSVVNPLLLGSSTASAFLEYSIDGGTTWKGATQVGNLSSVSITVTVQITNTQTMPLSGIVPANALVRIRTATTGTAAVTYVSGMEIVY